MSQSSSELRPAPPSSFLRLPVARDGRVGSKILHLKVQRFVAAVIIKKHLEGVASCCSEIAKFLMHIGSVSILRQPGALARFADGCDHNREKSCRTRPCRRVSSIVNSVLIYNG